MIEEPQQTIVRESGNVVLNKNGDVDELAERERELASLLAERQAGLERKEGELAACQEELAKVRGQERELVEELRSVKDELSEVSCCVNFCVIFYTKHLD